MSSYRVGFLGGVKKGRDHTEYPQWAPIAERNALPPDFQSIAPIGFTLSEMMLVAWGVRLWTLTGDGAWNDGIGNSDSIHYDQSIQDPAAFGPHYIPPNPNSFYSGDPDGGHPKHRVAVPAPTDDTACPDERFLVVASGPKSNYFANTPTILSGYNWRVFGSLLFQVSPRTSTSSPSDSGFYDEDNELFYPYLQFQVFFHVNVSQVFPDTYKAGATTYQALSGTNRIVGHFLMLGHSVPLYAFAPSVSIFSTDFAVDPFKWWVFENLVGQPVYNEDTGAQIADPFA